MHDEQQKLSTYFIRTFGCQMNVADSLSYARILENLGLERAQDETSADLLVVNTCSVREKAEEKVVSWLGSIAHGRKSFQVKSPFSGRGIIFVGCMATVRGDEIRRRFPEVRLVVPASELESFKDRLLEEWSELRSPVELSREFPLLREEEKFERFIPIIRGCINHCTYCIVPAARGDFLESVHPKAILDQIAGLIESGVKSITLLGQNVCAYGTEMNAEGRNKVAGWTGVAEGYGFAELLNDIQNKFESAGIWIKFLTSHPRDVNEKLIDVIAGCGMFSKHFHLPIQAGDDEVLRRMGRGYTSSQYVGLVEMIRLKIPDMRLTTDIIVGFPGEDENAFRNTLAMVEKIKFDAAFTFRYSSRSGTPAEKWADPVSLKTKTKCLQELISLVNEISLEKARGKIGRTVEVLVEGPATSLPGRGNHVAGRTREEEVVVLPSGPLGDAEFGRCVITRITKARLRSFLAERVEN